MRPLRQYRIATIIALAWFMLLDAVGMSVLIYVSINSFFHWSFAVFIFLGALFLLFMAEDLYNIINDRTMITTSDFVQCSADTQRLLVLDGLKHVKSMSTRLTLELKKLNSWLAAIDVDDTDPDYRLKLKELNSALQDNFDSLTDQITIHDQRINLLNINNNGPDNNQ